MLFRTTLSWLAVLLHWQYKESTHDVLKKNSYSYPNSAKLLLSFILLKTLIIVFFFVFFFYSDLNSWTFGIYAVPPMTTSSTIRRSTSIAWPLAGIPQGTPQVTVSYGCWAMPSYNGMISGSSVGRCRNSQIYYRAFQPNGDVISTELLSWSEKDGQWKYITFLLAFPLGRTSEIL